MNSNPYYRVIVYRLASMDTIMTFRALTLESRSKEPQRIIAKAARQVFGDLCQVASSRTNDALDSEGRRIYGPHGREVIPNGVHYQVTRDGSLLGYVSYYPAVREEAQ